MKRYVYERNVEDDMVKNISFVIILDDKDKYSDELLDSIADDIGTTNIKDFKDEWYLDNVEILTYDEEIKTEEEIEDEFYRIAQILKTQNDIDVICDLIPIDVKRNFVEDWGNQDE